MIIGNKILNRIRFCWGKSLFALAIFLLSALSLNAQKSTDFGGILQLEYQNNFIRNFDVWVKEDLRFDNNFTDYSRSKTTLGLDYKFVRYGIKVGAGLDFINKYTGKHIYRNRCRFFANASYKYVYQNWEFSYRTRFLMMSHDESTGYYNNKLHYYWRNRLQVSYQQRNSRYKYSLSGELYSDFNKDNQLILSTLMFEGDVEYRLTRRQYLSVFMRDYRDVYVESDQIRTLFLGIGWRFKH